MEAGSIQEVTERLKSWCRLNDHGLARVEFDQFEARQEVVRRLTASLDIPCVEIELPVEQPAPAVVRELMEKLLSCTGAVASITGIEWAFPRNGKWLDTLVALSFQRESLAALPVLQIWWVPSHMTEGFVLGVPDLDSWFRLRLQLTEQVPQPYVAGRLLADDRRAVSVEEARSLSRRFWERSPLAMIQSFPLERIWRDLAAPAVDALRRAGLEVEAKAIIEDQIAGLRAGREAEDPEVLRLTQRLATLLKDDEAGAAPGLEDKDPDSLTSMHDLAITLWARGDYAGARSIQERVLDVRTRVLGEEHPDTLTSMGNLARTLGAQGDYSGARRIQERVLEMRTRVWGEEHPDSLRSMNNLASTLAEQGDHAAARRIEERVLEIRKRVLGKEHPSTLTSMGNLASTLGAQGDHVGARRIQEHVLEIGKRVLGEEHPATLTSMNNLAATLSAQGDHAGARRIQGRVLEVMTRVLGEEHPTTLTSMNNLAVTLYSIGETGAAIALLRRCLAGRCKVLGENHPNTIQTVKILRALEANPAS